MPEENYGESVARKPDSQTPADTPVQSSGNNGIPPAPANGDSQNHEGDPPKWAKDIRRGEIYLIAIGILALAVNSFIAWVYWGQLTQMTAATRATQDAVCVASRTLAETVRSNNSQAASNKAAFDATVNNFHREQRAWITFGGAKVSLNGPNKYPTILVGYGNHGRTPAIDVRFGINRDPIEISRKFSQSQVDAKLTQYFKGITIESIAPIAPGFQQYELVPASFDDLTTKIASVEKMGSDLYVAGRITFKDVAGNPQWGDYCFRIFYINGISDFRFCHIGNQMSYEK